jgi:hypothetical protein
MSGKGHCRKLHGQKFMKTQRFACLDVCKEISRPEVNEVAKSQ